MSCGSRVLTAASTMIGGPGGANSATGALVAVPDQSTWRFVPQMQYDQSPFAGGDRIMVSQGPTSDVGHAMQDSELGPLASFFAELSQQNVAYVAVTLEARARATSLASQPESSRPKSKSSSSDSSSDDSSSSSSDKKKKKGGKKDAKKKGKKGNKKTKRQGL